MFAHLGIIFGAAFGTKSTFTGFVECSFIALYVALKHPGALGAGVGIVIPAVALAGATAAAKGVEVVVAFLFGCLDGG